MTYNNPNRNRNNRRPPPRRAAPSASRPNPWTGLLLLLTLLASLLYVWRPWEHPKTPLSLWNDQYQFMTLGLDLKGGLRIELAPESGKATRDELDRVKTVIENRINALGVAEPTVTVAGGKRVVVEIPGATPAVQQRAREIIQRTARLEFRIVNQGAQPDPTLARQDPPSGGYKLSDLGPVQATGEVIADAKAATDPTTGRWVVNFQTTDKGAQTFGDFTGKNVGRLMAVVLDDRIQSVATIQQRLFRDVQISGNFSAEDASQLALVLKSGALPIKIKTEAERAIGPTLGADAIRSGAMAALVGILLVFGMLFFYYGFWFGLVAALGLLFSSILILGLLGGFGATLTLPGIAGLVLTIGAAVDGNVISFERIKEEMHKGKGLKNAIGAGYQHSTAAILDVNASHLLSALALYNYSTGPVKGFAVTLIIGVIASTFSNLVFAKWGLQVLAQRRPNASAPTRIPHTSINFMKVAPIVTSISVTLALLGGLVVATKGMNYGVDFSPGTTLTVRASGQTTTEQVRSAVAGAGVAKVTPQSAAIQRDVTPGLAGAQYTVKVPELTSPEVQKLSAAISKLPQGDVQATETVGPAVGQELTQKTVYAVILGLGLILVYVGFRFDFIMGLGSILAAIHDVAIAMGLFSLLGLEFTIASVAALLTLIGYSLNDSIIVSDRIRENLREMRGRPYREIVNVSINQTLSRTVMTSVSTMLPLVSLLVFGGPVLRDFSLILLIGILVGTYSSIYIVAPMVVYLEEWKDKRKGGTRPAKA
ncbi:protein translocase subunit SecD [Deinococcus metallilatus]|uniref:Multifunctional fusion protein n=1 Tax=Deinococcus metallilatus TaxID=1211322 RepID=A0AAJ5JYM9_9DEIO|nr:protein translocase subunit SecD [Deinococcus metallilatus]MBB5294255.1 SecD/SecF fusion protein [Deinococcus metallilatus]QBY09031.1 protein translocase subunit SecD [Deinococcus metallilatus]RXJ10175.1 protein translocase subunit SecD [Deinococcus metallilatus]TLK27888.1 protein translocase subunit SecD [Deinococcus metallilatus]GMA16408.1 protein translocase subunit SecDF [Deinococcus metallilatus]